MGLVLVIVLLVATACAIPGLIILLSVGGGRTIARWSLIRRSKRYQPLLPAEVTIRAVIPCSAPPFTRRALITAWAGSVLLFGVPIFILLVRREPRRIILDTNGTAWLIALTWWRGKPTRLVASTRIERIISDGPSAPLFKTVMIAEERVSVPRYGYNDLLPNALGGVSGRVRAFAALTLASVTVAVVTGVLAHRGAVRLEDRRICKQMQRLDGKTYDPKVVAAIRSASEDGISHLSAIARHADARSWPGHLSLVSEDYDYVVARCASLHLPAPNVD